MKAFAIMDYTENANEKYLDISVLCIQCVYKKPKKNIMCFINYIYLNVNVRWGY